MSSMGNAVPAGFVIPDWDIFEMQCMGKQLVILEKGEKSDQKKHAEKKSTPKSSQAKGKAGKAKPKSDDDEETGKEIGIKEFFVYIKPAKNTAHDLDAVKANFHIHMMAVRNEDGGWELTLVLPKSGSKEHKRPNLEHVSRKKWLETVRELGMDSATQNATMLLVQVLDVCDTKRPDDSDNDSD